MPLEAPCFDNGATCLLILQALINGITVEVHFGAGLFLGNGITAEVHFGVGNLTGYRINQEPFNFWSVPAIVLRIPPVPA